jgi:uncharacterized cofD-like protein
MAYRHKHIVCFGGGNAMPKLILETLKEFNLNLVGITSMVDNGGSTGALRREFNVLPSGDIRRHLLALADCEEWKKKLWNFRFAKSIELSPGHFGHNFANVFIAGLEVNFGFEKALEICHQFLKVKGKALPVTLDKVQLIAELEDGTLVEGEDEIDVGQNHDRTKKIKRVFLKPEGKGYPKALKEIEKADFLIFGPGDLYTSIIACFLAQGVREAIQESKAKKILICPAMTKLGETQDFSVLDFVKEVEKYIGCELDYVLYNNFIPEKERIEKYKEKEEFLLEMVSFDELPENGKFIGRNLLLVEGEIKYDKEKLVKVLKEIIKF